MKIKIYKFVSDTDGGTNTSLYGTEKEAVAAWEAYANSVSGHTRFDDWKSREAPDRKVSIELLRRWSRHYQDKEGGIDTAYVDIEFVELPEEMSVSLCRILRAIRFRPDLRADMLQLYPGHLLAEGKDMDLLEGYSMRVPRFKHDITTPEEALAYITECNLAMVASMAVKKSRPKGEYARRIDIAQTCCDVLKDFGAPVSSNCRAGRVADAGSVKAWAEKYEEH